MNEFYDKRILVTGATGLIGYNLVERLLVEGAIVVATGRRIQKLYDAFGSCSCSERVILKEFDVSQEVPDEWGEFDYIFHAASPIAGKEISSKPVDVVDANVLGTRNCLERLKKQKNVNGKLILFSSATVYGSGDNVVGEDRVVCEEDTNFAEKLDNITSAYSESKRMIEVYANSYNRQYGIDTIIVRIAYVYGYVKKFPDTAFYQFIKNVARGEDIVFKNSGMPKRDNIYVDDVINGLTLVAKFGTSGESYNISSNGEKYNYASIEDIADIIVECGNYLTGKKSAVIRNTTNCECFQGIKMSNEKLKSIGWCVETTLYDGISNVIQRYLCECKE